MLIFEFAKSVYFRGIQIYDENRKFDTITETPSIAPKLLGDPIEN